MSFETKGRPDLPAPEADTASAARTLGILDLLVRGTGPHRAEEIARTLGIPRSTTYYILRSLLARGYVESASRGVFRLGPKLLDLYLAHEQKPAPRPAAPSPNPAAARHLAGVSRSYLWNPALTAFEDCSRFRKPPPYRIAVSNASLSNHWRVALMHGIIREAERCADRISGFSVANAEDDPARQAQDIRRLVAAGIDILLVSCAEAEALDPVLAGVIRDGIPVIAVDRRPASDTNFITHVAGMDISLGRLTAQWIAEKLDGRGNVVMFGGTRGASPAEERMLAAEEVFRQHAGITVLRRVWTGWRPEPAYRAIRELLGGGQPSIAAVWCDSGLQGVGSLQAFRDAGTPAGSVPMHTGGDLNLMYQMAITDRVPLAAMDYPPGLGIRAFQVLFDVLAGRPVPRRIEVESHIVISKGHGTVSVRGDYDAEDWVDWYAPPLSIRGHGLGEDYSALITAAATE